MSAPSFQGQQMAARQAALRKRQGPGTLALDGKAYDATAKRPARPGGEFAAGAGENAAFADFLQVTVNPSPLITRACEGKTCTYQGAPYTIDKVSTPEMAFGVPIAQVLGLFRTPPPDSATDDPATPGKRGDFLPPDATF